MKMLNHDSKSRSILKTITWRVVASLDTFLIAWFITGNAMAGASIAGIEVVTKIVFYYLHERAWSHTTVGALSHPKVEDETLTDFVHHHQPHFKHK